MNKSYSMIKQVIRDLDKAESQKLDKAASYLRNKMREKVSKKVRSKPGDPPGLQSGNLKKGIKFVREPGKRLVGVGRPASHAHLLEFGTGPRYVKNYRGKGGVKFVGAVQPRPFMIPTFEAEKENVEKILSEPWI
jgi:HK97 gp10 family phage protein